MTQCNFCILSGSGKIRTRKTPNSETLHAVNVESNVIWLSHAIWLSQPAIACSKLTIETLEQGAKYVFTPCFSVSIDNFEQVNCQLG